MLPRPPEIVIIGKSSLNSPTLVTVMCAGSATTLFGFCAAKTARDTHPLRY
jgi:hypothetical protein